MQLSRLPRWGKIRLATPRDAQQILDVYAPYVRDTAITFEYEVPALEEFRGRMETILQTYPYLVWDEPDGIKGYAYARRYGTRAAYGWVAELSVYVTPALQGSGVSAALYNSLIRILGEQGVWRVYAVISGDNPNSRRFHEKLGFQVYGQFPAAGYKLGQWHDVLHMELPLRQSTAAPTPLVSIQDIPMQIIDDILKRACITEK